MGERGKHAYGELPRAPSRGYVSASQVMGRSVAAMLIYAAGHGADEPGLKNLSGCGI